MSQVKVVRPETGVAPLSGEASVAGMSCVDGMGKPLDRTKAAECAVSILPEFGELLGLVRLIPDFFLVVSRGFEEVGVATETHVPALTSLRCLCNRPVLNHSLDCATRHSASEAVSLQKAALHSPFCTSSIKLQSYPCSRPPLPHNAVTSSRAA